MKRRFLWIHIILCIFLSSFGQAAELEVLTGFDGQKDLPVLNEILRQKDSEVKSLSDRINTLESNSYTPTPENALSKSTIQTVITQTSSVAQSSGTAVIDNSIPTLTETPIITTALNTSITASDISNSLIFTLILNLSFDSSAAG